ncbi:MAG: response regulator transcription factor [Clostridiales bacterium]|nr:response regulator transcription factor [Clostridiales bacterium]
MQNNILLIEDDASIREGVGILLREEGFQVTEAEDGFAGLKLLTEDTDLVILDVMMPGISGIKTCKEIRKVSNVPILFLTAKDQEADKLIGFKAGGDDYLVKPFSFAELLARINALLRRYHIYDKAEEDSEQDEWLERGSIRINTKRNEVYLKNKETDLTEVEYRILLLLMQYPKKIFSVQNLYESVWEEPFVYSSGNTVMVHIRHLRMKIEDDPQKPHIINTVWGKGYRFEEDTEK